MISHAKRITRAAIADGDIDAVIVQLSDTGSGAKDANARYRHIVEHSLGRVPVGCQIIMSNKFCNVKVISKNENFVDVQFDAEHAEINLRIW
jgi:hypothetical protein